MATRMMIKHKLERMKCSKCKFVFLKGRHRAKCPRCLELIRARWYEPLHRIRMRKRETQRMIGELRWATELFIRFRNDFKGAMENYDKHIIYKGGRIFSNYVKQSPEFKQNFFNSLRLHPTAEHYMPLSPTECIFSLWVDFEVIPKMENVVKIQQWWRNIYHNPQHPVGYKRIEREYEKFSEELLV